MWCVPEKALSGPAKGGHTIVLFLRFPPGGRIQSNGDDYDNNYDVVVDETVFHELLILQKGQFYDVF